jgi:CheY-like chemotaxis protein
MHAAVNPLLSNTIVVVDDEETICETLKDVLEEEGYAVQCAGDGIAALALLRAMDAAPRMIILDLLMPRMDGNEVRPTPRSLRSPSSCRRQIRRARRAASSSCASPSTSTCCSTP